jgi:hypothetical protein
MQLPYRKIRLELQQKLKYPEIIKFRTLRLKPSPKDLLKTTKSHKESSVISSIIKDLTHHFKSLPQKPSSFRPPRTSPKKLTKPSHNPTYIPVFHRTSLIPSRWTPHPQPKKLPTPAPPIDLIDQLGQRLDAHFERLFIDFN